MSTDIFQDHLMKFGIPPSRANIQITGQLTSSETLDSNLQSMGLSGSDLSPIDWRKKANISPVKNQENCGNCWAMSSSSCLTDRFIIQKKLEGLDLDPVITTQCVPRTLNQGCGGGSPADAGSFFESVGLVETSDTCLPWDKICTPAISCGSGYATPKLPTCDQIDLQCKFKETGTILYKAKRGSTHSLAVADSNGKINPDQTIINMKQELLKGPIVVGFLVPKDFMASSEYKWDATNGIFINGAYNDILPKVISSGLQSSLGNPSGAQWQDIISEGGGPAAHAVLLVGWDTGDAGGKYGKIPYWIIKNSWGSDWNDGGYFKFAMNVAPNNYNKYLGLDVPVTQWVVASTGQASTLGGSFGSGTVFDPDLSTGKPVGSGSNSTSSSKKVWVYVLIGILSLLVLYVLYRTFNARKRK